MTCQGYSKGRIEFISSDRNQRQRDYSERSLIELHALDDGTFFVRGIDVENKNALIFNIRLTGEGIYKFGSSQNDFDEIRSNDGMYHLWLNPDSRNTFHKDLRQALAELALLSDTSSDNVPEEPRPSGRSSIPTQTPRQDNKSSVIAHSTCRIEFTPDDTPEEADNYSDRSIIELRQSDSNTNYYIRAIDVENRSKEIFNLLLNSPNRYQFGILDDQADEIEDANGTYTLWLNEDSRSSFHETLQTVLAMLFPSDIQRTSSNDSNVSVEISPRPYTTDQVKQPEIPNPINCDPKDILTDVRNLSRFIRQGNDDEAAQVAKRFASHGIHLQVDPSKQSQNEEEFRVLVQLDGNEYGVNQSGPTIPVNVFPSTTIRELRAAFEVGYSHCPTSQYFFVNGNLVYDDLTMKELNVGPNSLFILYLITYPRKFNVEGPWKCSSCSAQNKPETLRCGICSASRME